MQQVFISMPPLPLERVYAYMHAYKHKEEEVCPPPPKFLLLLIIIIMSSAKPSLERMYDVSRGYSRVLLCVSNLVY